MTVVTVGNPIIRQVSKEVSFPLSAEDKKVIEDLISYMRSSNLIGMAAPQLGHSIRIFVTEIRETKFRKTNLDKLRIFINPELSNFSDELERGYEGCGSVPGLFGEVDRSKSVSVKWHDENGLQHEEDFEGLMARLVQHENDHLDGIVFIDKLATTKTIMSEAEYTKAMA